MSWQQFMTAQSLTLNLPRSNKRRGWIGVDIGTQAIKLAQIEQDERSLRIAASWTICLSRDSVLPNEETISRGLEPHVPLLAKIKRMFRGRSCAAVLPMSLVNLRSYEIPAGDFNEQRQMVGEELAVDLAVESSELAFDWWETNSVDVSADGLRPVAVAAITRQLAKQTANNLLKAGLDCQILDVLPWAIARAVELAQPQEGNEIEAAIDLGHSSPLLVLVKKGRPIFSRTIRSGGLQSIMQPLQTGLNISYEECWQLLLHFGIPLTSRTTGAAPHAMLGLIANPLHNLVNEVERTINYINQQFRGLKPSRLWLFAEGAMVKNLPEHLHKKLNLPVVPWRLQANSDPSDALYGVAASLSALALEASSCT